MSRKCLRDQILAMNRLCNNEDVNTGMQKKRKTKNCSFVSSEMLNISPSNSCLGCCPRGRKTIAKDVPAEFYEE